MTRKKLLAGLAIFSAGVVATIAGMSLWSAHRAASWIELKYKQGVGLAAARITANVVLPDIPTLSGKVKFLPLPDRSDGGVNLGYIVQAAIPTMDDLSKVPKPLATTQVGYQVELDFELRDADNFVLKKVESGTVVLWSGKSTRLQYVVPEPIPREIASRTRSMILRAKLMKCLTCEGGE